MMSVAGKASNEAVTSSDAGTPVGDAAKARPSCALLTAQAAYACSIMNAADRPMIKQVHVHTHLSVRVCGCGVGLCS